MADGEWIILLYAIHRSRVTNETEKAASAAFS